MFFNNYKGKSRPMQIKIMRGIPGSGKTSLAKLCWPDATICSADFYFETPSGYVFRPEELPRAHQQCLRAFIESVRRCEEYIIVDNTNLTVDDIRPYIAVAHAYGGEVEIVDVFGLPDEVMPHQIHPLPPWKMEVLFTRWREHQQPISALAPYVLVIR